MRAVATDAPHVVFHSAINAWADLRSVYTWRSWTFGWLVRMLTQVTFFTLIGTLLDQPGQIQFLVLGNALMTCTIEAMMVVASTTWERKTGTLPLLVASPVALTWVFVGRSLQWLASGAATSLVSLFALAPLFGVTWSAAQVLPVVLIVLLTAASTYCVGLFLAAWVLRAPGSRNIVSNVAYLVMMAICGVQVPVTFWPPWIEAAASALPLTHSLAALRAVAADRSVGAVLGPTLIAVAVGAAWLVAAHLAFTQLARHAVAAGTTELTG